MANKIKGITVEIGGNTGPLDKALKDVNKTSRNLQNELKEVNRQLRFEPENTVLLAQKQKLLSDSVDNTKSKLITLKDAEKQAQEQFKKGKISEEQYRALQREVVKTESQLKNLQRQAYKSNEVLENISKTAKGIGDAAGKVATKMTPVSVAIGGVGTAAVAAFNNVDEGADTVIKKTGATGEAAEELKNIYKDLASSVPDDLGEVGAAIGEVNTRFEFTGEKLKNASDDFLKFAKINDTDVNSAIQLVSRAMGDAGIEADDYNKVLDMLSVAAQKSGIDISKLTENLTKYGAPMRALGLDTETSIAMFAGWEKAGVNTEIAFSGMKKAISNWGKAGKDSTKEFAKTLDEIKKAPDIAAATSMAIEVFGSKAGPDLADAIQGGRFEVEEYIIALQNAEGTVNATYNEISDGTEDVKEAMNAAKIAAGEFGDTIMTALAPIMQDIANKAKELALKFSQLDDKTKKNILTVLALVAGIAPIAGLISGIATAVSGATAAIGAITGATGLLTGTLTVATPAATSLAGAITFLTGPIGLAVAGIAGLTAAGIALYKHLSKDAIPEVQLFGEETSEATKKAVGAYMELDEKAGQSLMDLQLTGQVVSEETKTTLVDNFNQMGQQIKTGIDNHFQESYSTMENFFANSSALTEEEERRALKKMELNHEAQISSVTIQNMKIDEILTKASEEKRALTEEEQRKINEIQQKMKENAITVLSENELEAKAIMERMKNQADEMTALQAVDVVKNITEQTNKAIEQANTQYDETIKAIIKQRDESGTISKEQADKLIEEAKRQRDEAVKNAEAMKNEVITKAKEQAGEHVNQVDWESGEVLSKWDVMKNGISEKLGNIKEDMKQKLLDIKTDAEEKWNDIKAYPGEKLREMRVDISNIFNNVWEDIKDVASNIKSSIQSAFDIKLPHFSLNMGSKEVLGKTIKYPKGFDVNWYDKGGIFDRASIIGVGEKRPEFVGALDDLRYLIRDELSKNNTKNTGGITQNVTINSPTAISPSETARQNRRVLQELALQL